MKRVYRRSQPVRVLHTRVHMQNHNPPRRRSARMIPKQPQQHLGFRAREDSRSRENSRYEFTDLCFPERARNRSYALSSNTSRKMPRAASQIEWARSKNTCLARLSSVSPCLRGRCWVSFSPIAICQLLFAAICHFPTRIRATLASGYFALTGGFSCIRSASRPVIISPIMRKSLINDQNG
jgi:hypothetical protein